MCGYIPLRGHCGHAGKTWFRLGVAAINEEKVSLFVTCAGMCFGLNGKSR